MSRLDDIAGTIKSLFWIGKDSKITATATQDRVYTLPDKSGTFAMLDDVGGGGVTAIGVTTANGVSGTSSGGTTPNLTIALGAITPSSVAASGNVTGANLSGTNTGDKPPGGSANHVQYNGGSSTFAGSASLTFSDASNTLAVGADSGTGAVRVGDGTMTGTTAIAFDVPISAPNLSGTNTGDKTATAFNTEARAQIEAALIAGTNITLTPGSSGATRTVTIDAAGGGGGLSLPVAMSVSSMRL